MTPSEQQKLWLKDYLYQTMQYRETYEEVYDHMLLAVENHPEQQYFATTVLELLEKDFGGNNGLLALEENCRQAVEVNAKAQFRNDFKRWFTTPMVIITAAMFMGLYYLQLPNVKTHGALLWLFAALLILPTIICSIRATKLGYKYGDNKASIKDDVFRRLAFTSGRALWKFIITSQFVQLITKFLFMLNDTMGMIIGSFLILLMILPAIKQFTIGQKYGESFKPVTFRRGFIYWRLFIVMFIVSLISKYIFATEHWPSEKSVSINIIYGIVTTVLVLMIINVFVVIKLYRSEFKTQMIAY